MKIILEHFIFIFLEALTVTSTSLTTLIKCSKVTGNIADTFVFNYFGEYIEFRVSEVNEGQMTCLEKDKWTLEMNALSDAVAKFNLTSDGGIVVRTEDGKSCMKTRRDYCVQSVSETNLVLRVCNGCSEYLQKCCGLHQVLGYNSENKLECQINQDSNWTWNSTIFDAFNDISAKDTDYVMGGFKENQSYWVYMQNEPQTGQYPDDDVHKKITLSNFYIKGMNEVAFCKELLWNLYELKYQSFCLDLIQNFSSSDSSKISKALVVIDSRLNDVGTFMKLPNSTQQALERFQIIFYIFVPLCSFFLLLVVLVHGLLWDKQNIHGYTVVCYCISLFLHYVTWICIPLEDMLETQNDKIMNNINEFFSYSTICWLTVLNFDIWITFRKVRLSKTNTCTRFAMYAAFSWIVPLLAVLTGVLITHLLHRDDSKMCPDVYSKELPPVLTRFMESIFKRFLFFSTLLGCNFLFFAHTVYKMYSQNRKSSDILQPTSRNYILGNILIKLSIVMGGCWLFDTIPLMLLFYIFWRGQDHEAINVSRDLTLFLHKAIVCAWMSEAVTVFESIAIFYIFCCKRKIYQQLTDKYAIFKWIPIIQPAPGTAGVSIISSRSSQNVNSRRKPEFSN